MQYVRLGSTGLQVSRICLGCMTYGSSGWREWVLNEEASRPLIQKALEHGINFFDTADMYSLGASEEIVGRAIHDFVPRDEVVIATKVYNPMGDKANQRGLSRKHIMEGIDASLSRLKMDYIDLYQIHRFDSETPIEETMEALNDVVRTGKALYIGASSMYAWQFAKMNYIAKAHGWAQFIAMQNHYNLIYREEEREMNPFCLDEGIGIIPWSPLARGLLTGTRTRNKGEGSTRSRTDSYAHGMYYTENDFTVIDALETLAKSIDKPMAEVALAWILHKPGITAPIIGASKAYQIEDATNALEIALTPEQIAALEAPYIPHVTLERVMHF